VTTRLPPVPEITPRYEPREFVTLMFMEISGLIEHRDRYTTNPDPAIKEQGVRLYRAKISEALWILGEYTGWGELKAKDEWEKWNETS
jgi:hypothetical protein